MQTFHNHLFECFPGPKVSASQEPPGWNISGQIKSCSSTKFRVIKLLQTYLSLEISIGCNDYLTSCLILSNWQCLWDTCSLLRLPLVFQYPGSTLSFSSACIKALSPPICLIYRVFYLWENFISTARGMWIYITFMGTFVHLVFSWIFALRFFFFLFWFHPFAPNPATWYGSHCKISLPPQCIRPSNICRHLSLPPCLVISLPS